MDHPLFQICELLAPSDAALSTTVRLAMEDPQGWVERYRGGRILEASVDLPWIALVDGLGRAGRVAELNWKEHPLEIMAWLDRLVPAVDRWRWTESLELDALDTEAFLDQAGERLRREGLALLGLDIDSDSYPLALVPETLVGPLRALVTEVGQVLIWFGGRNMTLPQLRVELNPATWGGAPLAVGALPLHELPPRFSAYLDEMGDVWDERAVAYEAVVGWTVNQDVAGVGHPGTVDRALLSSREFYFCVEQGGQLHVRFSFLLHAIELVVFDPAPVDARSVPAGSGLMQIFTPSGRTLMVCSSGLADTLQREVARARQNPPLED